LVPILTTERASLRRKSCRRSQPRPTSPHFTPAVFIRTMIVLRLILGLAAIAMLHTVIFSPAPLSVRERARRDRR